MKRFITNGCGEILLVLARSEPEISDGRGLSLFIAERSERVKVRHLENKLGIHGSPTCELVFDNMPCRLIGERQRGLITYVMALMNGARVGIAAQSLGVAEAAYRLARTYAHTRQQFGGPIERLPAVAEMVTDMKIDIEAGPGAGLRDRAASAITRTTTSACWKSGLPLDKDEEKRRKQLSRALKRMNGMLTPMSKYYCSEMCNRVAYDAIQVLGGSGYMKDYAAERYAPRRPHHHDLRRHQPVAGGGGGPRRDLRLAGHLGRAAREARRTTIRCLDELKQKLIDARQRVDEAVQFVKTKGSSYLDLSGRQAGRFGHHDRHRPLAARPRRGERAEEARRPAVHRPRAAGAADELRADPRRRRRADGRVRPAGRAGAGGELTFGSRSSLLKKGTGSEPSSEIAAENGLGRRACPLFQQAGRLAEA